MLHLPKSISFFALAWLVWLLVSTSAGAAQQDETEPSRSRMGHLVKVSLPINDLVSRDVRQAISQIVSNAPTATQPQDRPVVVLEFQTKGGQTGRGSELEACQALARYLASADLNRVQTVAYIPLPNEISPGADLEQPPSLSGHAVLAAIATDQLALEPGMNIGNAGADEQELDPLFQTVYSTIGKRSRRLPEIMALCLLDADRSLYRATRTDQGVSVFVSAEELRQLEATESVTAETLSLPGKPLFLSAEQLNEFRITDLLPKSRADLARQLRLNSSMLETDVTSSSDRTAVQLELPYLIDDRAESWLFDHMLEEVNAGADLIILVIDDSIGDVSACLSISRRLVELEQQGVQTVAFVRGQAQESIGVIALSCQQLIMAPDATLGGLDGETSFHLEPGDVKEAQGSLVELARLADRDWSLMLAMLDPSLTITRYVNRETREFRLLCNEEAESEGNLQELAPLGTLDMMQGLSGSRAEELGIARLLAEDMGQVQAFYQLEQPPRLVQLTATTRWMSQFAGFLTHPVVAMFLLVGGFFFLSTEMSAPGLSFPGLMAVVCFGLYFWSHVFEGSAVWLEVMMFVVGVVFILMELFVLPGFGVFGVSGILLMIASLVLAAQDFVIPSTVKEVKQLPYSLTPVLGGAVGVVAAVLLLRNTISQSRFFKQILLQPSRPDETGLKDRDPEAMVDWSYLVDRKGQTVTRLNPAGKVRIDGEVFNVISTGQLIDKNSAVVVVEAIGNRVVVQALDESAS